MKKLFAMVIALAMASPAFGAVFDGQGDNQTDAFGYYYLITGGKFPTGNVPNGDRASGGTFRYITDDSAWGKPTQVWRKDGWFEENASFALTLKNAGAIVYDNNGIEDGSYGDYYNATAQGLPSVSTPGLYRGFSMSNNLDWIYAGYFLIEQSTEVDTLIGYFDEVSGFDRNSPSIEYGMNIWSNVDGDLLPVNTGSFQGDVFSSDNMAGTFSTRDTGVDRVFGDNATDDIFSLEYALDAPMTLDPGVYWFSHDARIVPEPASVLTFVGLFASLGAGHLARRRRNQNA